MADITLAKAEKLLFEKTRFVTITLERAWRIGSMTPDPTTTWRVGVSANDRPYCSFSSQSLRIATEQALEYLGVAESVPAEIVEKQIGELP